MAECKIKKADRQARYRAKHKEKLSEYQVQYNLNNRDVKAAGAAKYRAARIQRTPKWLTDNDLQRMKDLYTERELLSLEGEEYHVDHIIPLQGKLVSGLHVPNNLQLIPAKENLQKYNKF